MRLLLVPFAMFVLVNPVPLLAEEEKKRPDGKRIAALVERLGDPHYPTRNDAEKELIALGEPALPAVRAAVLTSPSLEVAVRGQRVVRGILLNCRTSRSTGMEFALVPAGDFQMGSPGNERGRRADEQQHEVLLTKPFLIGRYEVTQAEYKKLTDAEPSYFAPSDGGKDKVKDKATDRFPVEQVSWFDAVAYCNKLSEAEGYRAYYELTDVKKEGESISAATVKVLGGTGYRLPTEAEWEYAGRGGTTTPFHFGRSAPANSGNFKSIVSIGYGGSEEKPSLGRTTTVGSYKPNVLEMYDVHGNAAEWCHDGYDKEYYATAVRADPPGPAKGDHKVVRGGSWMVNDTNCRSAARFYLTPGERKDYVGFRVARTP